MLPKPPPREGQVGFLYVPPWRIQGISVAGEQTVVQVPELDVCFDIGLCPRPALTSPFVAISHGHMDHVAGLPYYFSQRLFQKIGVGTCICHQAIEPAVRNMMRGWVNLEQQQTKFNVVGLPPDGQVEIKNNLFLRGLELSHTVPSLGYVVIERRSKLREEFVGFPQEKLRELKAAGEEITKTLQIPLVAYTGDTQMAPALFRDEFATAKVVITECTFFDEEHRSRATIGKHLHVRDMAQLLSVWQAEAVVLMHMSRRTNMMEARDRLLDLVGRDQASRVLFLMDHRENRVRYERQLIEASASHGGRGGRGAECPTKSSVRS